MYEYQTIDRNCYLEHHGIKGQKWGVRRFQNKDGSLTDKGIKRYATKGFSEDSYNSNKSKAGKIYDRVTSAHKYGGEILYNLSSDKERADRANQYLKEHSKEKAKLDKKKVTKKLKNGKVTKEILSIGHEAIGTYGDYVITKKQIELGTNFYKKHRVLANMALDAVMRN